MQEQENKNLEKEIELKDGYMVAINHKLVAYNSANEWIFDAKKIRQIKEVLENSLKLVDSNEFESGETYIKIHNLIIEFVHTSKIKEDIKNMSAASALNMGADDLTQNLNKNISNYAFDMMNPFVGHTIHDAKIRGAYYV